MRDEGWNVQLLFVYLNLMIGVERDHKEELARSVCPAI
jgi:hypothetical protein